MEVVNIILVCNVLDIIGYRLKSENKDKKDNFQTEEDKLNKEIFMAKKKEEKKKK